MDTCALQCLNSVGRWIAVGDRFVMARDPRIFQDVASLAMSPSRLEEQTSLLISTQDFWFRAMLPVDAQLTSHVNATSLPKCRAPSTSNEPFPSIQRDLASYTSAFAHSIATPVFEYRRFFVHTL